MPASKEMVDLILLQNELDGFPEIPKIHQLTQEQREIIRTVVSHIPQKLKEEISKRLVGIMIVKDLGGTRMTDVVFEDKSKGYIVFDALIFSKKANDWCTWKESSPFKAGTYKLKCTLADGDQNTVEQAFEYILMHEIAHILNLNNPMLPFWIDEDLKNAKPVDKYPYLKLSWEFYKESYVHRTSKTYKNILNVPFYRPDVALNNEKMISTYQDLAKTNFPSLYGVINPWDDFAESFVTYYHSIYHKRPWKIEILR